MTDNLSVYISLIDGFVEGRVPVEAFEEEFLKTFKSDKIPLSEPIFDALNFLFAEVDAFCADPNIAGLDSINEEQLRISARSTLSAIRDVDLRH